MTSHFRLLEPSFAGPLSLQAKLRGASSVSTTLIEFFGSGLSTAVIPDASRLPFAWRILITTSASCPAILWENEAKSTRFPIHNSPFFCIGNLCKRPSRCNQSDLSSPKRFLHVPKKLDLACRRRKSLSWLCRSRLSVFVVTRSLE